MSRIGLFRLSPFHLRDMPAGLLSSLGTIYVHIQLEYNTIALTTSQAVNERAGGESVQCLI